MHGVNMHLNLSYAAGPHTSVEYVGCARDGAGRTSRRGGPRRGARF